MRTRQEITKHYHENQRLIARLYNTHTPLRTIQILTQKNDTAYVNEIDALEYIEEQSCS